MDIAAIDISVAEFASASGAVSLASKIMSTTLTKPVARGRRQGGGSS